MKLSINPCRRKYSYASNNKIKVAHIATVDMSLYYLLSNQLNSLKKSGYDVVGISSPGPYVVQLEQMHLPHIAVTMTRRISPLKDLVSLWRLYQVIRCEKPAIVHTHTPKPSLLGQLAARLAGVPIVVNTVHGFYFDDDMPYLKRKFYIGAEKIAAKCSDLILSQNKEDIKTAVKEKICGLEKIKYLGNGIDVTKFNSDKVRGERKYKDVLDLPNGKFIVGFVGRLVAEKGVLDLLQAAQIILNRLPSTHFLFVGPIDYEKNDALQPSIASEYGVADACTFAGLRHDMPEMYALMDVFVLPSYREGFPRSVMEASAMKIPCVVTNIRGCRETVYHGKNGYVVPLGDFEALASAVIEILSNKVLARSMGEEGRRMAEEKFDEKLVFQKIQSEYLRLLELKGLTRKVNDKSRNV